MTVGEPVPVETLHACRHSLHEYIRKIVEKTRHGITAREIIETLNLEDPEVLKTFKVDSVYPALSHLITAGKIGRIGEPQHYTYIPRKRKRQK